MVKEIKWKLSQWDTLFIGMDLSVIIYHFLGLQPLNWWQWIILISPYLYWAYKVLK